MKFVLALLFAFATLAKTSLAKQNSISGDNSVIVSLYYESLCPYCKGWIADHLVPTYDRLEKHMTVELIPYGNAHMEQNGDSWTFSCQHGPTECTGNKQQSCILNYVHDQSSQIDIIHCIESSNDVVSEDIIKACLADATVPDIIISAIIQCSNGKEGIQLLRMNGLITDSLRPEHEYVPWVTFDHVHSEDDYTENCQFDLFNCLCRDFLPGVPECDEANKKVSFNNW